ncbi:hypothetical protein AB9F26_05050 [Falsihalocynthiibacter sp. BN13B15]|uniref:hypothetical protein n=1 Tax=Falsihalocynthiibacter sp. BN13B15 TaxID=3240871 RepID=UPI00351030A5
MTEPHNSNRLVGKAWVLLEGAAMLAFWAIIILTGWFLIVWIGFASWEAIR